MSLEEMQYATEKQEFDRKSAKIDATAIATPIIAFANAYGGLLAVGIEDDGSITGIDDFTSNINEILRAPFDFCFPSINVVTEKRECVDNKGKQNHILLIYVPQSSELHANHRDEVFLRIGDKSKKLSFEERMQLMHAKGTRFLTALKDKIIAYCKEPKKKSDIAKYCGYSDKRYFTRKYLKPLLDSNIITMTISLKPNSKNQRYVLNKIQNKI